MGQSSSSSSSSSSSNSSFPVLSNSNRFDSATRSGVPSQSPTMSCSSISEDDGDDFDYSHGCCIHMLPDACLANVFHHLGSEDRKNCSVVCRRWFQIEGQNHHRLSLSAHEDIIDSIPSMFVRFDSVTKLSLRCRRRSLGIRDDAFVLISIRCPNLSRLKLRGCRELTDRGIEMFAANCKGLKKFSCGSCSFGFQGLNAVLDICSSLEELSLRRFRGINEGAAITPFLPDSAASSLKTICFEEVQNGHYLGLLLEASVNLRTLKLLRCSGDWDKILHMIGKGNPNLIELHLERVQISDEGLSGITNCPNLEVFHLIKTPECTNWGVISVVEHCRRLRKLHFDGWKTNRVGDEGLTAVAQCCPNLQELVLVGVNSTSLSLFSIVSNCQNLERLALCGIDTISDAEILYIAKKCVSLKKLCIKACPISDGGLECLVWGCPNLLKVTVKKCSDVTGEFALWLRENRRSLEVNFNHGNVEPSAIASDNGAPEEDTDFPPPSLPLTSTEVHVQPDHNPRSSSSSSRRKSRLSLFKNGSVVACFPKRWSRCDSSSHDCAS